MGEKPRDFFISYTSADRAWAEWIAWGLEAAGYTTVIQAWDFRPGENFVLRMHEATTQADVTLALLSEAYLKALYSQSEWAAAFAQDPTGKGRQPIPVRVAKCAPEGFLRSIIYIDLVGLGEDAGREKLLEGVKQDRTKPVRAPAFPGSAKVIPFSHCLR